VVGFIGHNKSSAREHNTRRVVKGGEDAGPVAGSGRKAARQIGQRAARRVNQDAIVSAIGDVVVVLLVNCDANGPVQAVGGGDQSG